MLSETFSSELAVPKGNQHEADLKQELLSMEKKLR